MEILKPRFLDLVLHAEKESDFFLIVCLIASWLGISLVVAFFGFFNLLGFPLFGLLVFPLYFLIFEVKSIIIESWQGSTGWLLILVVAILCLHFSGVFVPETGFDAVWYHLPVLDLFREMGGISYDADLYQTANPLLSDLLFYPAFQVAGELGAKLTAYLVGLSLVVVVYRLSQQVLTELWSWIFLISVLLIQPVAWQFSSFYVDVAKAFWEVSLLWLLVEGKDSKKALYGVGLLLGASVATKAFSVLLIPVVFALIFLMVSKEKWQKMLLALIGFFTTTLPFYLYILFTTGSFFSSILIHVSKLQEIGGSDNLSYYLLDRFISLPFSWWRLFTTTDYVSVLLVLFFPIFLFQLKKLWKIKPKFFSLLILFTCWQWIIWWFIPPVSTRYAISGFIIAMMLLYWAIQEFTTHFPNWKLQILATITIVTIWHLLPRLVVAERNILYLVGNQTKQQYLLQFYDGSIDQHLQNWQQ